MATPNLGPIGAVVHGVTQNPHERDIPAFLHLDTNEATIKSFVSY